MTDTTRRLAYCASEIGCALRVDAHGPDVYSLIRAFDSHVTVGPSASLATTATAVVHVDPTITSAGP